MIKQQQPQQLKAQSTQVPQTITYAIYAYNSKTAEQTQRLKYGDLEIVLKNEHFEFVCKGGAVISNIKEILFMNSKIKGITDDITSIPPEEQRYYALNAFPKVLKIGRFNLNEEFIKGFLNDIEKKADNEYVNEIYQSLIGTTKNIETIVGDFSVNEENKYFRWQFVQSLRNGMRCKLIPKNNNEMYVSYIKNNGTQVKVPLDNNCYLNLYGDEQKKYLRVYEMADMTLPDPAPAPHYYDYGDDDRTPHVDEQKLTLYLDYYRYKRYNAIEKTRIVYYYTDDRNKYYSQDFTYPENIRLYYKKYSDTNQKKPEIVALYFKFKRDNPIISHMFDLMNPVGSIYTSMEARGPQVMFGVGAWEQIVDRFLYCANSSKETGGSKKISVDNLPPHSHSGTTSSNGNHVIGFANKDITLFLRFQCKFKLCQELIFQTTQ